MTQRLRDRSSATGEISPENAPVRARLRRLVITSGEPAGIGPDLCLAIAARDWPCDIVVAADIELLKQRAQQLRLSIRLLP